VLIRPDNSHATDIFKNELAQSASFRGINQSASAGSGLTTINVPSTYTSPDDPYEGDGLFTFGRTLGSTTVNDGWAYKGPLITSAAAVINRGDMRVSVANASSITSGDWIVIQQFFWTALVNDNSTTPDQWVANGSSEFSFTYLRQVVAKSGNMVSLDAPIPWTLDPANNPVNIRATDAMMTETNTSGFFQGQGSAAYTVTVSKGAPGVPTVGTITVIEMTPGGLTLVSMSGAGWTCSSNTCARSDVLNPSSSYPSTTVTVNVSSNAASQLTNQVTVLGGGSAMASATNPTTIGLATENPPFLAGEDYLGIGVYYLRFPDGNLFGYYNFVASHLLPLRHGL
jgi:hypothetical protein